MPRGDGTGPLGSGPRTGRGAGYCAGYPMPGWTNVARGGLSGLRTLGVVGRQALGALPGLGRGRGQRLGFGRGSGAGRGRRL